MSARIVAALALLALARPAGAQGATMATIEGSTSRLRYAGDTVGSGAFTITPTLHAALPDASLDASGGLSQFAGGGWSTQGLLAGAAFTPWRPVVGEIAGSTGGSVHADGARTAESIASLRLHLVRAGAGAWVGGSAGQTWDTLGWHGVRAAEVGAWVQRGTALATLSLAPTRVADTVRFTDAQLSLRALAGALDLGATLGRRSGDRAALAGGAGSWMNASAALWLGRGIALTATAGRYPADPLQGYRAASYAALGVRLGVRELAGAAAQTSISDRAAAPSARDARPLAPAARAASESARAIDAFEVRSAGAGTRTFRVHAADAARVEIAGDFTAWRAVTLVRGAGGWWSVTLPVDAGSWEMNVRVDGGAWLVPPGLTALQDEAGGGVGVVVVGPDR